MDCHDAQTLMHGYLDRELELTAVLQYERHVQECPACAKGLGEQQAMQKAVHADALYYKAPDRLRERLRVSLRKQGGRRAVRFPIRWVVAAACVVFFVGFGFLLAQFTLAPSAHERLVQEVAYAHIRSLQVDHKVDMPSSDQHTVKPWFNGKLDYSPPTPDLRKQDFTLVGGRLDYLDSRPVAALVYSRRDHFINVFLWPAAANEVSEPRRDARQGYQIINWTKGGMNFWVVSDLNPAELNELVQILRD
jgi:anti-sigma factor RsiW